MIVVFNPKMDCDPKSLLIIELVEASPITYDKSRRDVKKTLEEKEIVWRCTSATSGIPGKKFTFERSK